MAFMKRILLPRIPFTSVMGTIFILSSFRRSSGGFVSVKTAFRSDFLGRKWKRKWKLKLFIGIFNSGLSVMCYSTFCLFRMAQSYPKTRQKWRWSRVCWGTSSDSASEGCDRCRPAPGRRLVGLFPCSAAASSAPPATQFRTNRLLTQQAMIRLNRQR